MCGPALVGRAAPAAAPPPTDDVLASEALLGLAGAAYHGLEEDGEFWPAPEPAEQLGDVVAVPQQPGQDPERFYCPHPGCKRSFAELWRLKVHYRAPPNVRGSGKERGHGTRLTHCPKCNTALKVGGHHVKCPGVRAPSQRSNAAANAAKRQRRNSAAPVAAQPSAQQQQHHHQQLLGASHGSHYASAHSQQATPFSASHLLAPQHAEQQRAPWAAAAAAAAAASPSEGWHEGQQLLRQFQHQQLAQQLLQATASQQQGSVDAGALSYCRQLSRLQQLLEKVDQDLDFCDSEQPGTFGAAAAGGGSYGGSGHAGGDGQHLQPQAAAQRLPQQQQQQQQQQLSAPALALHQLLQRSHSSESSSNSSGATRSGSNSGEAGGSRLTVPGDSSDGVEAARAPVSAASLLAAQQAVQQPSGGNAVWQEMVYAALQQLLSGTAQQGSAGTHSVAAAGMAGQLLAGMHSGGVPAAAGCPREEVQGAFAHGGGGGSVPQLPAPPPLALPQQPALSPALALDAGHAQAFAVLQAMLCHTSTASDTAAAACAPACADNVSAAAAAGAEAGAEAVPAEDELEPVAALRALSAAAAAAAEAGAAATVGAAPQSAAAADVDTAALLRMLHDQCVKLMKH